MDSKPWRAPGDRLPPQGWKRAGALGSGHGPAAAGSDSVLGQRALPDLPCEGDVVERRGRRRSFERGRLHHRGRRMQHPGHSNCGRRKTRSRGRFDYLECADHRWSAGRIRDRCWLRIRSQRPGLVSSAEQHVADSFYSTRPVLLPHSSDEQLRQFGIECRTDVSTFHPSRIRSFPVVTVASCSATFATRQIDHPSRAFPGNPQPDVADDMPFHALRAVGRQRRLPQQPDIWRHHSRARVFRRAARLQ